MAMLVEAENQLGELVVDQEKRGIQSTVQGHPLQKVYE